MLSEFARLLPHSRGAAFVRLAALLATVPVWTLPVAVLGRGGFLAYLSLSSAYYRAPRMVFGSAHFPRREFGTIPASGVAHLLAAALYMGLAFLLCWLVPLRDAARAASS